jgi:hypothetical protein
MLHPMDPAAEALAGAPRRKPGAAADAPDAALWLTDPIAHAAQPPSINKRIIAALMDEIARGDVCTPAEIAAWEARREQEEE